MSKFLSMFSLLHYVLSLLCTLKNKSNKFTNKEKFYLKPYAEYLIPKLYYYYYYYYYYIIIIIIIIWMSFRHSFLFNYHL